MDFQKYLSNVPLLHTWDGGATWNTGGFQADQLETVYLFLKEKFAVPPQLLETGAGNSTICFLFLPPRRLVSIAPDPELFGRIRSYCHQESIPTVALEAHIDRSEWVLPRMAQELWKESPCFDFALIDGCHNWPMVFVDFFYANYMLRTGGYIMIDDVQLHSVKELARMLSEQPDFQLELDLGKALIFRRVSNARILGEWTEVPYIVRKSSEYGQMSNPSALWPETDRRDTHES